MDGQIRRQRILEAIKRLLLRESLNQPLMMIFEDLHWLDNETQAFLQVLSENVATARILLLVNYRPEYQHGWSGKTYFSQLRLDPLDKEQAEEMLSALFGDVGVQHAAPLRQFILDKTEGNPFFMEELVQTLREQGLLTAGNSTDLTDLRLPTTVQGVLAARMDRLPAEEKALLQTLAVIGREFPPAYCVKWSPNQKPTSTACSRDYRQQSLSMSNLLSRRWSTSSSTPSPKKWRITPYSSSGAKCCTNAPRRRSKRYITLGWRIITAS